MNQAETKHLNPETKIPIILIERSAKNWVWRRLVRHVRNSERKMWVLFQEFNDLWVP